MDHAQVQDPGPLCVPLTDPSLRGTQSLQKLGTPDGGLYMPFS